jgi:hypothetical protein
MEWHLKRETKQASCTNIQRGGRCDIFRMCSCVAGPKEPVCRTCISAETSIVEFATCGGNRNKSSRLLVVPLMGQFTNTIMPHKWMQTKTDPRSGPYRPDMGPRVRHRILAPARHRVTVSSTSALIRSYRSRRLPHSPRPLGKPTRTPTNMGLPPTNGMNIGARFAFPHLPLGICD